MNDIILETKGICKKFGELTANEDVNIQVRRATVHAIIGDNGAGTGSGSGTGAGQGRGGGTLWRRAEWIQKPNDADFQRFWPPKASSRRIGGVAILACIVPRPGPVQTCRVWRETPRGYGFGKAAMAMTPLFRIRPVAANREDRADIPVIVPVTFVQP